MTSELGGKVHKIKNFGDDTVYGVACKNIEGWTLYGGKRMLLMTMFRELTTCKNCRRALGLK